MNRRHFLCSTALAATALIPPRRAHTDTANAPMLLSEVGCSRATGYAEANKIVTRDGKTHVAWLDSPPEGFRTRIRTLDHATNTWSPTYTIGEGYDNHGGPALTIDRDGYLHVAYYPHHHPMRIRKSLRPNDASAWSEPEMVGERLTYPTLVTGADNTLYLTCRQSSKKAPWQSLLFTKTPGGTWSEPVPILQAQHTGYAHFMDALAWGPDHKTLHLVTRIHDGNPGQGHTVGYMQSQDYGQTWTDHAGNPIALPATADTLDVLAHGRGDTMLRAAGLTVTADGVPRVLYSDQGHQPDETWIAHPGPQGWERQSLRPFLPDRFKDWDLFVPGGITHNRAGSLVVVLTATPPGRGPGQSGWGHPDCEVLRFESTDGGKHLTVKPLSPLDGRSPYWLPNIERDTGHHPIVGRPGIIYTEGGRGETNKELVQNRVHWAGR